MGGAFSNLMECPRCHHVIEESVCTGTGTNGGWCGCGYGYYDDFDPASKQTKEEVDAFYESPRLVVTHDGDPHEVYRWLRDGNAPVSAAALIDEALARVRTREGKALARQLAARKPGCRDGVGPNGSDITYPPYSVPHGLLTWALRNLVHVVAAQHLRLYDARTMPDPTDPAALFADIKEVYEALFRGRRVPTPNGIGQWLAAADPAELMKRVLLDKIGRLNYADVARDLLQEAQQWHPYAGPHLSDEGEE
jgi:hypothetical protein